jgi:broad specificity phosphatase PhoE
MTHRKNPVQIFLFRHGETDWNVQERFQGHIDIPLNENGRSQARSLVPKLLPHSLGAILSSDLSRAFETGNIVASSLQIPIFSDPRLRESHLGAAQGLTREEIEIHFGINLASRWRSTLISDADISYPGGETGNQIMNRAFEALHQFIQVNSYQKIGVATHGGVIRRIMQKLLPPNSPTVPIPNGIIYEIRFNRENEEFHIP